MEICFGVKYVAKVYNQSVKLTARGLMKVLIWRRK